MDEKTIGKVLKELRVTSTDTKANLWKAAFLSLMKGDKEAALERAAEILLVYKYAKENDLEDYGVDVRVIAVDEKGLRGIVEGVEIEVTF